MTGPRRTWRRRVSPSTAGRCGSWSRRAIAVAVGAEEGTDMRSRAARGQSLIETSLGLMVFITILMFGIYFAEVGALTLKVQEAANFAMWNATGRVMHDPEQQEWQRASAVTGALAEANGRYVDYDGRSRVDGSGGVPLQLAIARAQPIQVDCEAELPAGVPT